MQAKLIFGQRYRAEVAIDPMIRSVLSAQMVSAELERYQLFGRVTDTLDGYTVEAVFRGKTGTYMLPEQVQTVEMIGVSKPKK